MAKWEFGRFTLLRSPIGNRHDCCKSASRSFRKMRRSLSGQMQAAFFDPTKAARYMLVSTNPWTGGRSAHVRARRGSPILQALMMLVLDRQNDVTSQARAGAGRIQLRMRPDGQLLELPEGKTTIGSSPRCNVRIER